MSATSAAILPNILEQFPRTRTRRDGVWWLMIGSSALMAAASLLLLWVSRVV